MIEKCDEASQLVPQYKKPAELKKKALAMKDLLSKLENAEADGEIQDIESIIGAELVKIEENCQLRIVNPERSEK